MNLFFPIILSSLVINPTASMLNYTDINRSVYVKEDISQYELENEIMYVKDNEDDYRQFVYLEMMNRYEQFSNLFIDLIINRQNYLISGDNFKYPEDPKGINYKVTIVALPSNNDYSGKLVFEVKLFPEIERIDLSKFNNLFIKENFDTYARLGVIRNDVSSVLKLTNEEGLQAIDNHFRLLGIKEWSRNPNILESQSDDLTIKIKEPHITEGYVEGYYEVIISPAASSELLLPNVLTCFIYATFDYQTISKDITHELNQSLGSAWSKVHKWTWENSNIWYTALNIGDYLTNEEKAAAKGNYIKAFAKKYDSLKFSVNGYGIDYDDEKHNASRPVFSIEEININQEYVFKIVSFKMTGFGVYSEVDHYIKIKITKEFNLQYLINGYIGVQGFGAKWQYTSLYSKISKWTIS